MFAGLQPPSELTEDKLTSYEPYKSTQTVPFHTVRPASTTTQGPKTCRLPLGAEESLTGQQLGLQAPQDTSFVEAAGQIPAPHASAETNVVKRHSTCRLERYYGIVGR